jgi:HSP20 family protein
MEDLIELRAPVFSEPANSALVADIYETSARDAYMIQVAVPGLKAEEIDINVDTYSITVSTQPERTEADPKRRYIVREVPLRPLVRTFNFPVEIDKDKVKATLNHGMLLLCVPKAESRKRRVPVKRAA